MIDKWRYVGDLGACVFHVTSFLMEWYNDTLVDTIWNQMYSSLDSLKTGNVSKMAQPAPLEAAHRREDVHPKTAPESLFFSGVIQ